MSNAKAFACTACAEDKTGAHLLIDSNPICYACFRYLVTLALESESSFPANWAGQPLSPVRYADILGPELLKAYQTKAVEYACPVQERVFCSRTDPPRRPEACGNFVGRWREVKLCVRCEKCMWYTCLRCEESFSIGNVAGEEINIAHECDPSRDAELEERAFKGLVRGVDWQLCPNNNCKRRIEPSDGCNHVRCDCRTHFCFICGRPVVDGQGHWKQEGGCPRFGKKGSTRAIYDDEDEWNDNGDDKSEVRAMRMQMEEDREGEALRRAMEMQMQILDERRRELLQGRGERRIDNEGPEGGSSERKEQKQHRRRRRRRHRDDQGSVERHHPEPQHHPHRCGERQDDSRDAVRIAPRRHRGLREFLSDAADATEQMLFGGTRPRQRLSRNYD